MPIAPIQNIKPLIEVENDRELRVQLAIDSFFHFIAFYLPHLFTLAPALFHKDIIDALESEDELDKYLSILGFRGSAKTTIIEAFVLWSMLNGKHNFIIYLSSTITDAKMKVKNISSQIEDNQKLLEDFSIDLDNKVSDKYREKWSEGQITIGNCTLMAKSVGSSIRGAKYKDSRPDLIVCDDIEDVEDAATKEKREKTRNWVMSEVIPGTKQGVMADNVKIVFIGNLVHRDCLQARLKKNKFVNHMEFWLYDEDGNVTWEALYPTEEAIQREKNKVMLANEELGRIVWAREYLGKLVDESDVVLKKEDVQRYPKEWLQRAFLYAGAGMDFAFTKKQSSDYTAIVRGVEVKNDEGERRLLILPNNVQSRMNLSESMDKVMQVDSALPPGSKWYPEDVTSNKHIIEVMERNLGASRVIPMKAVKDKRARLTAACFHVETGRVLFPEEGCEDLLENILGFGVEEHDDYADAFAYLVLGMVKKTKASIL